MASVENIKNNLIDKILAIKSEDLLLALDHLITSSHQAGDHIVLNTAQKEMLKMGLKDAQDGNFISQDELDKSDLKWLNEK